MKLLWAGLAGSESTKVAGGGGIERGPLQTLSLGETELGQNYAALIKDWNMDRRDVCPRKCTA